ncbi:MAG TPA: hypothetical protein PLV78_15360 [Deltaproteobacteria bacterium]|nr:hypothetical protein [Deltaproteobacteria bacterium]
MGTLAGNRAEFTGRSGASQGREPVIPADLAERIAALFTRFMNILVFVSLIVQACATLPEQDKGAVDSVHEKVSDKVISTATRLDSFFDDERVVEEENMSTLRLIGSIAKEKDESVEYNTQFRLRLVLPRTKERLKLVISGNGEDELELDNTPEDNIREDFERSDEQNISLSLWYTFLSTPKQNLNFHTGIRFRRASPVLYAGPRYRYLFTYGLWNIRFVETIRYYTDEGWEAKTSLDFERAVLRKCLFRTNIEGSWFEGENGYFYNVNFLLYHPLSLRRALVYEWTNSMQTRPNHQLAEVVLRIRYRQKIFRDWLFLETAPQVSFSRDKDFDTIPGIYLGLEAVFGRLPDL